MTVRSYFPPNIDDKPKKKSSPLFPFEEFKFTILEEAINSIINYKHDVAKSDVYAILPLGGIFLICACGIYIFSNITGGPYFQLMYIMIGIACGFLFLNYMKNRGLANNFESLFQVFDARIKEKKRFVEALEKYHVEHGTTELIFLGKREYDDLEYQIKTTFNGKIYRQTCSFNEYFPLFYPLSEILNVDISDIK